MYKRQAIPSALKARAEELREALTEAAAESDEELMVKYFDEGALSQDEIIAGLCAGVREGIVTPVCCCAAQPNVGVTTLMAVSYTHLDVYKRQRLPFASTIR